MKPVSVIANQIETVACPFCKNKRAQTYRNSADIVRCLNCNTVYLRTRINKDTMSRLYQSYNSDAPQMFLPKNQSEIKNSLLRRDYWLKEILSFTEEKGNFLDIGCGWGAFLDNARNYGFNCHGIEITKKCAEFARLKLKINVSHEQFLDTVFEDNYFNVITLNHVLEHLPEPKETIYKIFNILKPEGIFCGIVPNIESLCSKFLRDDWEWLDASYHYVHYDIKSLRNHLELTGFTVEKMYTKSGDFNRQQLMEVINKGYRPHSENMATNILNSIEHNGFGEEIRFIARKSKLSAKVYTNSSTVSSSSNNKNQYLASIIIPVFNKVEYTQQCLETIYTINNGTENFEVIVVDNSSSDDTPEFLKFALEAYNNLSVITNNQNTHFSSACNAGAKIAKGTYLVFLNNDTLPTMNWLQSGLNPLLFDKEIGVTGSKLLYPDKTIQHAGIEFMGNMHPEYSLWPVHRYIGLREDEPLANISESIDSVTGACFFISSDLFCEVGGFSEEYSMYFEDSDLCFKVKQAGKKILYEPQSVVIHFEGKSNNDETKRHNQNADSAKIFFKKWADVLQKMSNERNARPLSNVKNQSDLWFLQKKETTLRLWKKYIMQNRVKEAELLLSEFKSQLSDQGNDDSDYQYKITQASKEVEKKDKQKINDEEEEDIVISIVVPTYNNLEYTKGLIDSIYQNTNFKFELIFIDNNSKDGTAAFLNRLKNEHKNMKVVINTSNVGFPAAINQGILIAKAKNILIANNDIVFTNGWLESMTEVLNSDPSVAIVGPMSNYISGPQLCENAAYTDLIQMHDYAKQISKNYEKEKLYFPRVAFLCTLIKKEVFETIGGLDERFSPGNFEDDDFCLRAQLAGYKTVIAKDVFIHHYGSKSFKAEGNDKYDQLIERNRKKFIEKWGADPDEIWIKGKTIKQRNIKYPINSDAYIQSIERALIHIEEAEYHLASEELVKAISAYNPTVTKNYKIEYSEVLSLAEKNKPNNWL